MATQSRDYQTQATAPITKTPDPNSEILDKHGAALFLGFSSQTLDTWIQKKRIPYSKLPGGSIRFRRSQLIEFLKKYEVGA
jgi:excisionase family DNA binding protein